MIMDDNDDQMIFGHLGGLKLPDICLTGEEIPDKNLTQETCPDRGSNPGPLRDRRACYCLTHSGGRSFTWNHQDARYNLHYVNFSRYGSQFPHLTSQYNIYNDQKIHIFVIGLLYIDILQKLSPFMYLDTHPGRPSMSLCGQKSIMWSIV